MWEKHILIDRNWANDQLTSQFRLWEHKLSVRVYTIKFSGTMSSTQAMIHVLMGMIKHYVLSPAKIAELGADYALLQALSYFGDKDPTTDGKYGEVLLFALVEAVLGCKMVAHKIRTLTNFSDQVKGGDGIFLGEYLIDGGAPQPTYMVGESKVMNQRSESIKESLESLQRFHDTLTSSKFTETEFIVAKDNLVFDNEIDLEEVYDRLTPATQKFKEQILVHPILLMFNAPKIPSIEQQATTNEEAEDMMRKYALAQQSKILDYVRQKLKDFPGISRVHLEFFMLPVKNVDEFRHHFYFSIHRTNYKA